MTKVFTKRNLLRAFALLLAAAALAAGLEWVMQRTLPPVFVDGEVDLSADPMLIQRGSTYLHASGREALAEEWHPVRFAAEFLLQLGILILLFPLGLGKRMAGGLKACLRSLRRAVMEERRHSVQSLCCFLITFGAVFLLGRAWIGDVYHRTHWMAQMAAFWAAMAAACLTTFRRTLGKKPEVLFLAVTLMVGGVLCWVLPDATRVSLDDGHHFQHALNYSMMGRVRFTGTDWDVMQQENQRNYEMDGWEDFLSAQDAKYAEGAVYVTSGFHLSLKEYWTATQGLGLFLGRLFRLRYWDMWSLGRFTGLLAYALIGYFAIRRLKSGRMLVALTLMMPGALFLACNYSYDPGVTAGIVLSCAYWMAQWQERDQKLKNGDVAVMVIPMLFACYAKAIYFPIFLLFLFLPAGKFRDGKHMRAYMAVILLAMVAVMLHILMPLGRSGGQGDTRAEGNVNTFQQIQFILGNPLTYAGYLWHYLQSYLDPNRMGGLLAAFGYQGGGNTTLLVFALMAVAAFTDASEEGLLPGPGVRIFGEVLLFGAMVLMITSMYVWFSAVGSPTFDGMQQRYLIPYIYPAMALMGSNRIGNQRNPAAYHGLLLGGMAFTVLTETLANVIEYYH